MWNYPILLTPELNGRFFISDFASGRVVMLNYDGECIASSSIDTDISPFGLAFDHRTGLLYVVDQAQVSVKIFK